MTLAAWYVEVRAVHVTAVALSGGLFALRALSSLAGARWPAARAVRYSTYAVDSVLLVAALLLVAMLPAAAFANHWLSVKLALLALYIGLGILALRERFGTPARAGFAAAALTVYLLILGTALARHPLGWLRLG